MTVRGQSVGPGGTYLNRTLVSGLAIGVFVGFLGGYFVGASRGDVPPPPQAAAAPPPPPGTPPAPSRPDPLELQQRIANEKQLVAADPGDEKTWIALGNDYFDSNQAQNAVDAYAAALKVHPDNPDVLTDQGVMYRQLGQFAKAVANFTRAGRIDPRHLQSQFNLGIVYAQDLKRPQEAKKAFNQVIAIDPASPQAAQARQLIAVLEGH
jgi:cytochrome c-type biogenesis protein CcmH/NrfG